MPVTLTLNFPGAPDAALGSLYKIERSLDNVAWTVLAADQAATSPYVSPASTLFSSTSYQASVLELINASGLSSSGYAYIDDEALVHWTGKSGNQLTGLTWLSGYGLYLAGSDFVEAHETYTDAAVSISLGVALYRITHISPAGVLAAPAYLPVYAPPLPASTRHCVVIVNLTSDLGIEPRAGVTVTAQLAANDQMIVASGEQLGQGKSANRTQTTNAFGLAFFQCWQSSGRVTKGGNAPKGYTFNLDGLVVTASLIPGQAWALLEDIADA